MIVWGSSYNIGNLGTESDLWIGGMVRGNLKEGGCIWRALLNLHPPV